MALDCGRVQCVAPSKSAWRRRTREHERSMGALAPMSKIVKYAAAGIAGLLARGAAFAAWELNMPVGVTELSRDIHGLHMLIFWICVLIAVAVFGMMIYSIVKFRHSQGAVAGDLRSQHARPKSSGRSFRSLILVGMAIPAAATLVQDRRHAQLRAHHQSHRLPVEVALRVPRPERQRSSRRWRATATRPASWTPASIRTPSTTTCWTSTTRWSCRSARRCACC